MTGRLEWPDPTPDGPSPEEERLMALACQTCDGTGRVEVFACEGICECGMCPDLEDCPECCGHEIAVSSSASIQETEKTT